MNKTKRRKLTLLKTWASSVLAAALITGCGSSGNSDVFLATGFDSVPVVAPEGPDSAGNVALGSVQRLPSGPIPSARIPSNVIPSRSVRSSETPTVGNIRTFEVNLEPDQVLDDQGAGDQSVATLNFNTTNNELTFTASTGGQASLDISFDNVAGLPLNPTQTLQLGTPLVLSPEQLASVDAGSAAISTGSLRGQILPTGWELVLMTLQPEQVVEENGIVAAPTGASARAFFTIDTSDPNATPPVVLRPVGDFVINDADINVGGGFAGLNGARQQIALSNAADGDPTDGVWAANLPADPNGPQPIANLQALLAGVYNIDASDGNNRTGNFIRAQITPGDLQVIRMELQPEQVIEENGIVAAPAGSSAVAFFTIDTSDPNATPPVVLRPVGDFVINDADINVGGGFAGLNGARQQIALSNAADGDPTDGVWAANLPADPNGPQPIANLQALLAGVYNIDASDGNNRTGNFIRAQITPGDLQVIRMELQPEQVIEENGIVAAPAGSSAVAFFTIDTSDPNATPPVVLRPVGDFVINDADINVGGGFAGLNGARQQIALSNAADGDPTDGVWAANLPADPNGPQPIANLQALLAGVYNIDASDGNNRTGNFIRAQITPGDLQVIRMELQPEQVIEENGIVAAPAGSSAVAFFTIDTSDPNATPPVVLRPVGDFVINDADINVGGGFAGLNGARQQIALSNAADGDPTDGVWAANLPADPNGPQPIANLQALLAGVYNIDASDGNNRTGNFIRAQIAAGQTQVFLANIDLNGANIGRTFITVTGTGAVTANALLEGVVGNSVTLANSSGVSLLTLANLAPGVFGSGAPAPTILADSLENGVQILANFLN